MNIMAHMWRRGYLTLIDAGVPMLRVFDLERPVFTVWLVHRSKPLVTRVSVPSDGEKMDVSVSHPRNLRHKYRN